jgi:hypothetical protein
MDYPDEALHESQVPLQQFVRTAEHLLSQDQTPDNMVRFIRFVLAGRFELDGHQTRIFVNARQAASPPLIDAYQHRRDLDSAIGVTRGFPFRVALALFPLASFRDTLTEDNHVKYNPTSLPGPQVGVYATPDGKCLNCFQLERSRCLTSQDTQYGSWKG